VEPGWRFSWPASRNRRAIACGRTWAAAGTCRAVPRALQTQRAAARLLQVVDLLFARPIVTIAHIGEALELSHQSATRYVEALEAEECCARYRLARNRIYRADAVWQPSKRRWKAG